MTKYVRSDALLNLWNKSYSTLATHVCEFGDELMALPIVDIPDQPHGEWIPVTSGMPQMYKSVLVASIGCDVFIAYRNNEGRWREPVPVNYEYDGYVEEEIIAWMALPEPYKEEGDEE